MKWIRFLFMCVTVDAHFFNDTTEFSQNIQRTTSLYTSGPCSDKNHIFLTPGVLPSGGTTRACLSRFFTEGPADVTLTLVTQDGQTVSAVRELHAGDGGCIDYTVPQAPNTKAEVKVEVRYPQAGCVWSRSSPVRISSGQILLLQSELVRYHGGDIVRIRARASSADLTPGQGLIEEIWLEGPDGSQAVSWRRRRMRMGLAQLQYRLDTQAPHGQWTIRARLADGTQGNTNFWVGDYQLPPFLLSVRHSPTIMATSERIVWNVCVRYPWSEAVEGMLVIRLRGAGGYMGGAGTGAGGGGVRTAVRLKAPKACHRHAIAAKRVGLDGAKAPHVIIADFSFQEDGTRIWQNTTVVSQVVEKRVSLQFLSKFTTVIAPGLPYKLKIKATRWDNKPSSNERLRICRSPSQHPSELVGQPSCDEVATDGRGVARVMFTTGADESFRFYRFVASLLNDSSISTDPLYLPVKRSGVSHAAFGPLSGESLSPGSKVSVPLYLNLKNVRKAITVHFVVITRGGTIHRWGATSQCPVANFGRGRSTSHDDCYLDTTHHQVDQPHQRHSRDSKLDTSHQQVDQTHQLHFRDSKLDTSHHQVDQPHQEHSRESKLDTNHHQVNQPYQRHSRDSKDPESLLDRHLLRIMLPIRLSHQMCPDSHLIAYFYHDDELVSASKRIEIEECFANKVQLNWLTRQTAPGSVASLQITTPGPALCALTAVDVATKWMQPDTATVKDTLMSELKKLIGRYRNMTSFDATGDCFMSEDSPEIPSNSKDLAAASMAAAGILWLGTHINLDQRCKSYSPSSLTSQDLPVSRSDFSEAWLWKLVAIGLNGTGVVTATAPDTITRYETTALCVSRNGLAVSSPVILQVFREFFIHADAPKKLRRGDETIIKYRIFNYLYEPLAVEIQLLTDPHLEITSPLTESACIPARSSVALRGAARARGGGGGGGGPGEGAGAAGGGSLRVRAAARLGGCGEGSGGRRISDEIVIRVEIEHEGVPQEEHRSTLLCGTGSSESTSSKVTWTWPKVVIVPGSERMSVWAAGDLTGPLLADADALISLPRGCGEQNMARLATNLLALNSLNPLSPAAAIAKDHVIRGFARQLQYVHPGGGFSAFGSSDGVPSTWLTAFAIRYLRKAHKMISPGQAVPSAIETSELWLLNQQMENGCFRNEGQVFHREMKGGLGEEGSVASVALTAYVITSLMESSVILPARVLTSSMSCLRALPPSKTKLTTRTYARALLAYALMRLRRYEEEVRETNEADALRSVAPPALRHDEETRELVELLRVANRNDEYVWWETESLSTSIEATSYALLALSQCELARRGPCAPDARAALRWLTARRNTAGGFLSTQDTLVALEAISAWSSVHPSTPTHLNITVRCGGSVLTNVLEPEMGKLPLLTSSETCEVLKVGVDGSGCALVQSSRSYHAPSAAPPSRSDLTLQVVVHTEGPFDCDRNTTFCFCAAVVEVCVLWSGRFPEMALLEATLPGGFGGDASLIYSQMHKTNTLLRRIEMTPNGNRVFLYLGTKDGSDVITGSAGHQCYNIHAVGPRARTRAAYVKLMDYYNPDVNDTQIYTIPEDCPPRISNEKPSMTGTDNLFNNARSLTGDDPIISEESFDDFIDGAPLEDPTYVNLTNDHMNDPTSYLELKEIIPAASEFDIKDEQLNTKDIEDENEILVKRSSETTTEAQTEHFDKNDQAEVVKEDSKENDYIGTNSEKLADAHEIPRPVKENLKATSPITGEINVDNPKLADFHVIDSDKDLEVPSGVNGPVAAVMLPPGSFVLPPQNMILPPPAHSHPQYPAPESRAPRPHLYLYHYDYPMYRIPVSRNG